MRIVLVAYIMAMGACFVACVLGARTRYLHHNHRRLLNEICTLNAQEIDAGVFHLWEARYERLDALVARWGRSGGLRDREWFCIWIPFDRMYPRDYIINGNGEAL